MWKLLNETFKVRKKRSITAKERDIVLSLQKIVFSRVLRDSMTRYVGRSVGLSVGRSVRPSVRVSFFRRLRAVFALLLLPTRTRLR